MEIMDSKSELFVYIYKVCKVQEVKKWYIFLSVLELLGTDEVLTS